MSHSDIKSIRTDDLNDTLGQMNLNDIYKAFHPKATENIFLSSEHGILSRRNHMRGHKASLCTFKKFESYQVSFLITNYEVRNQL